MTAFVALVRAVNLGADTTLPSAELRRIGEACSFAAVRTFIASGNLLFTAEEGEEDVAERVRGGVEAFLGKPALVLVRSAAEMGEVVRSNPFPDDPGNRVVAFFLPDAPTRAMIDAATGVKAERLALGQREIVIAYDEGMGRSKLKLPAFKLSTGRNMNSVAKMADLLAAMA
ncbi:MAG: DUF1697 domain-containing protein [Sphingomicrobium sp.]